MNSSFKSNIQKQNANEEQAKKSEGSGNKGSDVGQLLMNNLKLIGLVIVVIIASVVGYGYYTQNRDKRLAQENEQIFLFKKNSFMSSNLIKNPQLDFEFCRITYLKFEEDYNKDKPARVEETIGSLANKLKTTPHNLAKTILDHPFLSTKIKSANPGRIVKKSHAEILCKEFNTSPEVLMKPDPNSKHLSLLNVESKDFAWWMTNIESSGLINKVLKTKRSR